MRLFLPAVGVGLFLMAIDQLLAVATYARIGSELHALNSTSWIATSYFLTLTSFQPLYGKLSDIFGRKPCLLFAYAVFAVGCLGCGLARDIVQLCVARALAGIGGGGMNAVVSILTADLVPLRDRGIWQGYMNIIASVGTSVGAPLGGFLADSVGWRWSFLGQVPLCIIGFVAVYYVVDVPSPPHENWSAKIRQIDFLGALTLIAAVVALLLGLDAGSNLGWSHTLTVVALCLAPVVFAAFVLVEVRFAAYPFAPGHVIFDKSLFACYLVNFAASAAYIGVLFFVPLFFQAVLGASATRSGAYLVPAMVAVVIASVGGGWIIRRTERYYWITVLSMGLGLVAIVPLTVSVWFQDGLGEVAGTFLMALGYSAVVTTTLVGLIANSATEDMALVVASSYLFRSLGSSIGVSLSAASLQQVLRTQLAARFPDGDEAKKIEEGVRQSLEFIHKLSPWQAAQVKESYKLATLGGYGPTLIFLVMGFVVSFWIRERPLKK
ncbi:major facilitator superfamily [Emericellopsis atlantica]|uniref:Major facilitator superfamily n=1 Tax=Emericellopsis atlantica TaxID=2614577 RepID=A0A9P8CPW0_9HYPO|nr:major facilitator superfamily [Emericellopsis atlantica]KAG9254968.1 major facilitator superfamily [Emericellopsis atlantica]